MVKLSPLGFSNCFNSCLYCYFFSARSISEEFSSGDTRYKDNDETASSHGKERKDKEDRDEGIGNTFC